MKEHENEPEQIIRPWRIFYEFRFSELAMKNEVKAVELRFKQQTSQNRVDLFGKKSQLGM
ncbi:CLUMA_CG012340, isoform A [Clunio marinus]|uniref:CLUMA_CG012340, isoform A n=1 Tax=Clunio marinus TaxID=568069 RepID=A0A1J1IF12_9DIPT|nr:CLUMA_CG012340, isoform A [Clunio marinus]